MRKTDEKLILEKLILITGGSRGIGAACVRLLARPGLAVALNYARNTEAAQAVQREVQAGGSPVHLIQADVGDEAEVIAMFAQIDTLGVPLAGLVNNAGVVDIAARVDEMSAARLERMWRSNVLSAFMCAREAVKRMSTRHGGQGGSIVNISSAAARLGSPGQYVDYAASKAAIDTFTMGLAKEVAAEGIRVNAIRPGIIATDIHASGGQPDRATQLAPQVPMQRAGTADEVAQAVAWLMSDAASYTTGAILDVSGGR
jgi:NAD(P)-dependent dehydrogenase (short-subunit alcohol dehydrogenase family)